MARCCQTDVLRLHLQGLCNMLQCIDAALAAQKGDSILKRDIPGAAYIHKAVQDACEVLEAPSECCAPELLEVCHEALDVLTPYYSTDEKRVVDRLVSAIVKAEGRTNG